MSNISPSSTALYPSRYRRRKRVLSSGGSLRSSSSVSAADSENLAGEQNVRRQRMEQLVSSSSTGMGSGVRTYQVK